MIACLVRPFPTRLFCEIRWSTLRNMCPDPSRLPLYVNSLRDVISRKPTRDERFCAELGVLNRDRLVCRAFALLYREAVRRFGEGVFASAASDPNSPDSVPLTAGNRAAI